MIFAVLKRRADARRHAAADERELRVRKVGVDLHDVAWLHVIWSAKVPRPVMLFAAVGAGHLGQHHHLAAHRAGLLWPRRHQKQLPQAGMNDAITWSPTRTW